MTMNLKDLYYGSPMEEYEYMQILLLIIPQYITNKYELDVIEDNGWIYQD